MIYYLRQGTAESLTAALAEVRAELADITSRHVKELSSIRADATKELLENIKTLEAKLVTNPGSNTLVPRI